MLKALKIFIPTFFIVLIINQAGYGFCFKMYCLAAAFPRVVVISAVITGVFYWISTAESKNN